MSEQPVGRRQTTTPYEDSARRDTGAPSLDRAQYAIHVAGHLEARWAAAFDGLHLAHRPDGTTVLSGPVPDQSALHGLLGRVRDAGLPLLSVVQIQDPQLDGPPLDGAQLEPGRPGTSLPHHDPRRSTT